MSCNGFSELSCWLKHLFIVSSCNTLQHTTALQHTATHCNALQLPWLKPPSIVSGYKNLHHTPQHCSTLQHAVNSLVKASFHRVELQHCNIRQHCNTLQHTATHCNSLHWSLLLSCLAAWLCNMLHHCNTLQHTATHGNTLQQPWLKPPSIVSIWNRASPSFACKWAQALRVGVRGSACTYYGDVLSWHTIEIHDYDLSVRYLFGDTCS